jgi:hypothetical protein
VNDATSPLLVALIGRPGLLGDVIYGTLAAEPDLVVVAELASAPNDLDLAGFGADVVVWNGADELRIAQWLNRYAQGPGPRVLAITNDGQQGALWELTPHRVDLGALSPRSLVETIREIRVGLP